MTRPEKIAEVPSISTLASIAVVIAALYVAKGVLVPFTLAVLLSFLLSPVCSWLERRRLGRISAVLVTASLGFTVLGIAARSGVQRVQILARRYARTRSRTHSHAPRRENGSATGPD
jgi:predicted PurR-regulated permease PerM